MVDEEGKKEASMHWAFTLYCIGNFRSQEARKRGPLIQRLQMPSLLTKDTAQGLTKLELKPRVVHRESDMRG